MARVETPRSGNFSRLIDQQLELAASKLPALHPSDVHPAPEDHEERKSAHPTLENVLLGTAEPTPEMLEEIALAAPELSDEELARQALSAERAEGETDD